MVKNTLCQDTNLEPDLVSLAVVVQYTTYNWSLEFEEPGNKLGKDCIEFLTCNPETPLDMVSQ